MASLTAIKKDANNTTSIVFNGNKKLVDTDNVKYMQFNTPAHITCPYASEGCSKFCYVDKAEAIYPSVRENHNKSLEYSKMPDFVERTTNTIRKALDTKKYKGFTALMRLHESGDFYSVKYLTDWLDITNNLTDCDYITHFYTKSFQFFIDMDDAHKTIFADLLASGHIVANWSVDETTTAEQWERVETLKALYPNTNVYFALPNEHIIENEFTHICRCADCGECRICSTSQGSFTAVGIH